MFNHNNLESTSSSSTFVWFKDGIGFNVKANTYTFRASNIYLNLQRIAGLTGLAFVANLFSQAFAAPLEYRQSFQAGNIGFIASWTDRGWRTVDQLMKGACNVTSTSVREAPVGDDFCVQAENMFRMPDPRFPPIVTTIFATNPVEPATCDKLYRVSRCIASIAELYSSRVTVSPEFEPGSFIDSDHSSSYKPATIAAISVASICALGTLAFFARKVCRSTNQQTQQPQPQRQCYGV